MTTRTPAPSHPSPDKVAKWLADQAISRARLSSWLAVYGQTQGKIRPTL